MGAGSIIKIILEFAAVVLLIIGFANEQKVIDFEDRIAEAITVRIVEFLNR